MSICHTMSAQVGAMEQVVQAVKQGEISQAAIQASVNRVTKLKRKYLPPLADTLLPPTSIDMTAINKRHAALASRMYAQSTTVVRSAPGRLPITKGPETKCVYLLPGKAPLGGGLGGGVVDSGEEKTREPYLKSSFIHLIKPDNTLVHAIQYFDSKVLDPAEEALIDQADVVVFCTRNASLSQYQRDLGLSLGQKAGSKLIAVATCDPYDFLDDVEAIQNYITTYEPTPEAFQSALDIIFGVIPASGKLPVGRAQSKPEIQLLDNTSEDQITRLWTLWQEIFPAWPVDRDHLAAMVTKVPGVHLIHEKGFSLAYYHKTVAGGLDGMISVVGVLESYRGQGLGTALINRTRTELNARSDTGKLESFGVSSSFPRFWPGVPTTFAPKERDFFIHRGITISLFSSFH
jgi:beta-N-acetylhexosaminidase